jgi:lipopolysaccharide export system protein LptA
VRALAASVAVALLLAALAQTSTPTTSNLPSLTLRRDAQTVVVQQTATDAEGGIFGNRTFDVAAACAEADTVLTTFYAPAPKQVETRLDDTLVLSNIVLRRQPRGNQDAATLDLYGGSLEFDFETYCPTFEPSDQPDVILTEGRTTVRGAHLRYDNASGRGEMAGGGGLVSLERAAEGDSPALTASAERLSFVTDEAERTFTGNVTITAEDRVSEAETLVYNDETGVAVLRGNPASSRRGAEFVQGDTIVYYLDSNDVVVTSRVAGELEIDLELPAPPTAPPQGE